MTRMPAWPMPLATPATAKAKRGS